MREFDLNNVLVCIFSTGERTEDLTKLCFEKLGYKNIVILSGPNSFREKYFEFAEMGLDSSFETFIRSDADRLVFEGMTELVHSFDISPVQWLEGIYFDRFMNRFRGGTPHVMNKELLLNLHNNRQLMPDVQKPEAALWGNISVDARRNVNIFTNLHDYEQYPSKVCNTIVNRIFRNDFNRLYDKQHLDALPKFYKDAVSYAHSEAKRLKSKNKMDFNDYSFLDEGFPSITEDQLEDLYIKYQELYRELKLKHDGDKQ